MTDTSLGDDVVASDLFFSLSAILIVVLCLMSQTLQAVVADPLPDETALARATTEAGQWLVLARSDGVTLSAPDGAVLRMGLGEILSPLVTDWARAARSELWLVIATDARDSAFLLDTALARAGVAEVRRVRLDRPCPAPRLLPDGLTCDG